jgi:hypothetical protein
MGGMRRGAYVRLSGSRSARLRRDGRNAVENAPFAAAIRLEQLWNKLLEQSSFSLYCAYAIDVFEKEFAVANLEGVLCTHTHLVPAQSDGSLEALNRSMDQILGSKAAALRVLIKSNQRANWAVMPSAEAILLWLRNNLPDQVDRIVARARQHYELLLQPVTSVHPA